MTNLAILQKKKKKFIVKGNHKYQEIDCINPVEPSLYVHPNTQRSLDILVINTRKTPR